MNFDDTQITRAVVLVGTKNEKLQGFLPLVGHLNLVSGAMSM